MVVGSGLSSCEKTEEGHDELVVEGWICQDSHPIVLLHQSYALADPKHSNIDPEISFEEIMQKQMIIWGRVAISDGEEEVVLTGRLDTLYTPPFVYTTTKITGEVGKTYRIMVDYENYHASAYTTIQKPFGLDSLTVRLEHNRHTSHVVAYLSEVPQDYYFLLEYRLASQHQFIICPIGVASYEQQKDHILSINVLSRDSSTTAMTSALHHFVTNNEEYILRLIRIDKEQYAYFSALTTQLASQGMYFMSTYSNLPTNLDGAIGYWAGFGKQDYHFFINKDTTYRY